MSKYRFIPVLTVFFALALAGPALAVSQTSALQPGGLVSGGTATSSANFTGTRTSFVVRGEVIMKSRGKVKVTARGCRSTVGTCRGSVKTRTISKAGGTQRFVVSGRLSRASRVIVFVRSGSRILARHNLTPSADNAEETDEETSDGSTTQPSNGNESGSSSTPSQAPSPPPPPPVVSNICTEYMFDGQLGYEVCTHWKRSATIMDSGPISGGTITYEAWRTGATWASVGNRVYSHISGTLNASQATSAKLVLSVCGLENYAVCNEQQSSQSISLSAGNNTFDYSNSFVLSRPPTTTPVAIFGSNNTSLFSGYNKLNGCRANIPGCATPLS